MHFSIPDTQEIYSEATGTTYTGYNIYINGSYHCCLRYKKLHSLNEQLSRSCMDAALMGGKLRSLPTFPPKRLLPLTSGQIDARRAALEQYLQLVGQDTHISKLEIFQNFLLNAQLETAAAEGELADFGNYRRDIITLEVFMTNGYQLQVNCRVTDSVAVLLQKVGETLQLASTLMAYFCLFLIRRDANDSIVLLRKLMNFEAPYLSRLHSQPCQILLRKCYWNPQFDLHLLQDPVALNLLFIQTVSDVEHEWIIAPTEVRQKLHNLKEHGLKKEYMEMARQLPLYGCLQFSALEVDYPDPQAAAPALISIGNRELSLRTTQGAKIYETKFRVTRMRCWRVTALHNTLESKDTPTELQLSFEYLMSKQTLRWVTITSPQAMLMSVCLQSMVDELLSCQDSHALEHSSGGRPSSHNGHPSPSNLSSSSSTQSFSNNDNHSNPSTPTSPPVQFLAQRPNPKMNHRFISSNTSYSAVFFRNTNLRESIRNEAFEGIGDDDL